MNENPDDRHHSVYIDHDTFASLAGRIKANPLKYFLHYPLSVLPLLLFFIITQAVSVFFLYKQSRYPLSGLLTLLCILFLLRLRWKHIIAFAYHGDLCACKVVSINPLRVAVYTDLRLSSKKYPVIKVIEPPIKNVEGKPLQLGDLLAAVALYRSSSAYEDRWEDFNPIPVQCFSFNELQNRNSVIKIDSELWRALDSGIEQIGERVRQLGLYCLWE